MTDPTPDDLASLARAMGYTVTLDDSGGYGVVLVLYEYDFHGVTLRAVFNPTYDSGQAWEVMAWLMRHRDFYGMDASCLTVADGIDNDYAWIKHDGTAAGIRRAVAEAAIRVAKS